jgi:hypothetical protein
MCAASSLGPVRRSRGGRGFFQSHEPRLELPAECLDDSPGALGLRPSGALEELVEGATKLAERLRLRRRHRVELRESRAWILAQSCALWLLLRIEKAQEANRVMVRERRRGEGESGGYLLPGRDLRERVQERWAQETLGENLVDFALEILEDLEPSPDPQAAAPKATGDRPLAEPVTLCEIGDDLELFTQRRSPPWVVAAQSFELSLDLPPRLHKHPDARLAPGLQRKVALEAVDEKQPALLLERQQWLIALQRRLGTMRTEELQGDRRDGNLSELAHRSVLSGSEST